MRRGQGLPELRNEEKMHIDPSQDATPVIFSLWPSVKDAASTVVSPCMYHLVRGTTTEHSCMSESGRLSDRMSLYYHSICGMAHVYVYYHMYDDAEEEEDKEGGGEGSDDGGRRLFGLASTHFGLSFAFWVPMRPAVIESEGIMARSDRRARRVSNPSTSGAGHGSIGINATWQALRCWQPRS